MTHDDAPTDPPINPTPPDPSASEEKKPAPVQPRPKRRWIRRILLGIFAVVVLLLILVAITPALLSTGPGRTFILSKINDNLNGHVTVADWSIGWFGGIHATDVKVFDDANRQILQIPKLGTQVSLLGALRGNIHLGDTRIEGLDFFAQRFSDGTINFARLAKSEPSRSEPPRDEHADKESKENEHAEPAKKQEKRTKLPIIDGELQLIGCRGTFQDDQNPDPKNRTVEFRTIAADVKIAGVNDPIEDTVSIVAYAGDGSRMASFSASGKMQIASDNEMLTAGQMKITQKLVTSADLKHVQQGFGGMLPIQFTSGNIDATLDASNDAGGITISPVVKGADIAYVKDGVAETLGGIYVDGKVNLISPAGASAKDATTNVTFSNLRAMGIGSAVVVNGSIEDLDHSRKFNNVTADISYNLPVIWDAIKPMLSREQKESLKDVSITGSNNNKPEHFVINGSLSGDRPFNEAIADLTASGEFVVDSLDGEGASLKNLVLPISAAGGKARIAYAGKSAGQEFAPPADLNGGKFSLAGATIDLTGVHPTLTIPDGTKLLENVGLNPLFARSFLAGWLSNPVFAGADKATGTLSVTVKHCNVLPADALVLENLPENKGVMDMQIVMTHIEIGSKLVSSLNSALALVNPRGKVASNGLIMDIPDLTVHIEHGITTEDMKLEIPHNPPVDLAGAVVMKTTALQMTAAIPLSKSQSIKLAVTGTVDNPKLDTGGILKQNLNMVKSLLGNDKGSATQP